MPHTPVKQEGGERQGPLALSWPVCPLFFSDEGLTAILPRVVARAVRAAGLGKGWWRILEDQ